MNVIARLEHELAYYDSPVHRFNHYTTRIPIANVVGFNIEGYSERKVGEITLIKKYIVLITFQFILRTIYIYIYIYIYYIYYIYIYIQRKWVGNDLTWEYIRIFFINLQECSMYDNWYINLSIFIQNKFIQLEEKSHLAIINLFQVVTLYEKPTSSDSHGEE